jgi:signal transduction histidine kinase/HAMP domain-containing protein
VTAATAPPSRETSVRQRILWTFLVIIVMTVLARTFSHWVEDQRRERVEALRTEYQMVVHEFFTVLRSIDEAATLLGDNLTGERPADPQALRHIRQRVIDSLRDLRGQVQNPEASTLIDQVGAEYSAVIGATDRLLAVIDPASPEAMGSQREQLDALTDLWASGSHFMASMLALAEEGTSAFSGDVAMAQAESGFLNFLNTAIHFVVILVATILVFILARSITRPVQVLTAGVEEFSKGKISPVINVNTRDEFAQLARCFEAMSEEIQRMLSDGKKAAEMSLMVSATLDVDEIARRLINVIRQFTGGRLIVLTIEEVAGSRWLRYTSQAPDHFEREVTEEFRGDGTATASRGAHSVISIPLIAQRKVVGSLEIRDHSPEVDIERQTNLVSSMLVSVSMALRNAQLFAQIRGEKERAAAQAEALALANARLEESQRFKSQFLAGMSHRLRTPLNSVIGCTDLILSGVLGGVDDRQREALEKVRRCGHTLIAAIDHILNYSRLEAGSIEMLWGEFDVAAVIGEAVSRLDPTLCDGARRPTVEVAPDAARWRSDRVKCRYIVQYLLENAAVRARDGDVCVHARTLARSHVRTLEIRVSDTGPRIDPDRVSTIFEPFHSGDEETGTGLGLTIAKQLATLLGGDLTIDLTGESGSTFVLWVPEHRAP